MCSHKTSHVDVKLNVLDEMEKLMKLLTSADYDNSRPGILTDEDREELAHERSIKHRPPRKHPYD